MNAVAQAAIAMSDASSQSVTAACAYLELKGSLVARVTVARVNDAPPITCAPVSNGSGSSVVAASIRHSTRSTFARAAPAKRGVGARTFITPEAVATRAAMTSLTSAKGSMA